MQIANQACSFMSSLTHCSHTSSFSCPPRPLAPSTTNPLQADTQSSTLLRSRCPNHLNPPRLTTSATQYPRRLHKSLVSNLQTFTRQVCDCAVRVWRFETNKSSLRLLSFKDTPQIHLTIVRSVLSKLFRSSAFIAQIPLQAIYGVSGVADTKTTIHY